MIQKITYPILILFFALAIATGCKPDPLEDLPAFELLLPDSVTVINTGDLPQGEVTMFIHFDSDCKSCQEETDALLKHMDKLKYVKMYFISVQKMERLRVFKRYFKLEHYPNVVVGQDTIMFFPKHFRTASTPLLALYDKKKKLRAVFEGKADIPRLLATIQEIQ